LKKVLIAGANGMIGQLVLQNCLNSDLVSSVTTITRKPLAVQHPKLTAVIHNNFLNYAEIEDCFKNIDTCYYCIGVYTGQVPVKEFKIITVDITRAFCETLRRNSEEISFCFLSGQGADSTEKSKVLFAREKGIAENSILRLKFKNTFIFRPGYIYPDTPRKEPNFGYTLMRLLYKPFSFIYPNIGLQSSQLANKIFTTGLLGGDRIVYENKFIRN
jgi:nucleoside-diphosphate-sugar epimerase